MESSQAATQGCRELVSRDLHHLVSSPRVSFEFPKGEKHLHFKCLMIHRLIYDPNAPLFCFSVVQNQRLVVFNSDIFFKKKALPKEKNKE